MNRMGNVLMAGADVARLDSLAGFLGGNGFTVATCGGATPIFEEIRENRPELVVIDLLGNQTAGFQWAREMAGGKEKAGVPVVLIGAAPSVGHLDGALDAGAAETFTEPLDREEFLARLRPLLRVATMSAELSRRTGLARRFGCGPAADLGTDGDDRPYDILLVGDKEEENLINEALGGNCATTISPDPSTAEETLSERFFDACVMAVDSGNGSEPYLDLCSRMRDNPRLFNLPVVMLAPPGALTGKPEPYRMGASRSLESPVRPELLRNSLVTLVTRQRRRWEIRKAIEATLQGPVMDTLTGGYNFDFLKANIDDFIDTAGLLRRELTIAFFLIPQVSHVRHLFGDVAADDLIRQLSVWITRMVRAEDMTARYGEYDFCAFLPDTPMDEARFVMERIASIISYTDFAITEVYQPISVPVEVGFSELIPGDDAETLIKRAHSNLD
ncbi:MAG: diguanylate cyclase [Rhodospirillales bacterium]